MEREAGNQHTLMSSPKTKRTIDKYKNEYETNKLKNGQNTDSEKMFTIG